MSSRWVREYELIEQAGRGAQGVVWKARRRGSTKLVAIKIIDISYLNEKQRELALSEIRVLSMMSNSNAGLGRDDGAKSPLSGSLGTSYGNDPHHVSGVMSVAEAARAAAAAVAGQRSPTSGGDSPDSSPPSSPKGAVARTKNRPHPSIMRYMDSFVEGDNELCIVLEWAEGGTLQDWLDARKAVREGKMSLNGDTISSNNSSLISGAAAQARSKATASAAMVNNRRLKAMSPTLCKFIWHASICLLTALEEIHANSVLHRDIKAGNIFLSSKPPIFFDDEFEDFVPPPGETVESLAEKTPKFPRVFIGDFGVSTVLDDRSKASTLCGTPYYLSPETASGLEYDQRSDLWSLGVALFLLANARLPFEAANYAALILKITQARAAEHNASIFNAKGNKNKLSPVYQLKDLVNSCMEKSAKERPTSQQLLQRHFIIMMASQLDLLSMYSEESRTVADRVLHTMEEQRRKREARREGMILQTERRVSSRAGAAAAAAAAVGGRSNSRGAAAASSSSKAVAGRRGGGGGSSSSSASVSPARRTDSGTPASMISSPPPPPLAPINGVKRVGSMNQQQPQSQPGSKPGSASTSGRTAAGSTNNSGSSPSSGSGGLPRVATLGSYAAQHQAKMQQHYQFSPIDPSSSSPVVPPVHQQQQSPMTGSLARQSIEFPGGGGSGTASPLAEKRGPAGFYTQAQLRHAQSNGSAGAGGAALPAIRGLGASAAVRSQQQQQQQQQHPPPLGQMRRQPSGNISPSNNSGGVTGTNVAVSTPGRNSSAGSRGGGGGGGGTPQQQQQQIYSTNADRRSVRDLPDISGSGGAGDSGTSSEEGDAAARNSSANHRAGGWRSPVLDMTGQIAQHAAASSTATSASSKNALYTTVSPSESSPLRNPRRNNNKNDPPGVTVSPSSASLGNEEGEDNSNKISPLRQSESDGSMLLVSNSGGGATGDNSGSLGTGAANESNEYDDDNYEIDWQDSNSFDNVDEDKTQQQPKQQVQDGEAPLERSQTDAPAAAASSQQGPSSPSNNTTKTSSTSADLTEDQRALAEKMNLVVAEGTALIGRDAFDRLLTVVRNNEDSGSFGSGSGSMGGSRIDQAMDDLEMALRVRLKTNDKLRVKGMVKDAVHACFRYCLLEAVLDSN